MRPDAVRNQGPNHDGLGSRTDHTLGMGERVYFIRRYRKGVAQSGTSDVFASEHPIEFDDLIRIAQMTGPGKYLLGERGAGIRGFRKITDCVVPEVADAPDLSHLLDPTPSESKSPSRTPLENHTVFDAETISVRRSLKLSEMSNNDLMDVMHSMVRTPLEGGEEYDRFRSDLQSLHAEMERRGFAGGNANVAAAEVSDSAGTISRSAEGTGPKTLMGVSVSPVMAGTIGIGVGALVGWMATDRHYKAKLDSLNIRIQEMESNIKEAERAIKRAESRATKAAESPVAPKPFNAKEALDNHFLSEFNYRNGPSY
jgi:hypothetical protein